MLCDGGGGACELRLQACFLAEYTLVRVYAVCARGCDMVCVILSRLLAVCTIGGRQSPGNLARAQSATSLCLRNLRQNRGGTETRVLEPAHAARVVVTHTCTLFGPRTHLQKAHTFVICVAQ
jgi:hypothetical protein